MGDSEKLLGLAYIDHQQLAQSLLKQYYAPLHHLAYSLLGDADEADDIVQETLLVALRKIEDYQPGTDLKAWLCRITINCSRQEIRKRKIRQKWYALWHSVALLGTPPRSPEDQTTDQQLDSELWQAVNALNDKHKIPIVLHYIHGMTAREIAAALHIREGTVYSRLHYACRTLAAQLSQTDLEAWVQERLHE